MNMKQAVFLGPVCGRFFSRPGQITLLHVAAFAPKKKEGGRHAKTPRKKWETEALQLGFEKSILEELQNFLNAKKRRPRSPNSLIFDRLCLEGFGNRSKNSSRKD